MLADWMDGSVLMSRFIVIAFKIETETSNQATLGETVSVLKPGALVAMSVSRMKRL